MVYSWDTENVGEENLFSCNMIYRTPCRKGVHLVGLLTALNFLAQKSSRKVDFPFVRVQKRELLRRWKGTFLFNFNNIVLLFYEEGLTEDNLLLRFQDLIKSTIFAINSVSLL